MIALAITALEVIGITVLNKKVFNYFKKRAENTYMKNGMSVADYYKAVTESKDADDLKERIRLATRKEA